MSYDDMKAKLFIDTMRLDDELIQHPMLLLDVIELTADAMLMRDNAKNMVERITAEAALRFRVPEKDGKMPSEARISSMLPLDGQVKEAQIKYEDAKHNYNLWSGLAEAYREKGGSLKRIAELTIAGFLAPNMVRRREMAEKRNNS